MDYAKRSLEVHERFRGKIALSGKVPVQTHADLSTAYTPGVAAVCEAIAQNEERVWDLTIKRNAVAVVSDGSAVLGLGNIGPRAAIPVMEGKALLFKEYADIDAWPICIETQDTEAIIETVKCIAPVFGGINLEDISAPRCFEVETRLQDIGIPVFHDDQHGTAIVLLAALINAAQVVGKHLGELKVVINGAGAAGIAIAKLLNCLYFNTELCTAVKELLVCDSQGIIHRARQDVNTQKKRLLEFSNPADRSGSLIDALKGADVFIGVSRGNLLQASHIATMATDPIIFALANPIPEIFPEEAKRGGAAIVGTGRSDFPNQVNNVLAFPGIFRGVLDVCAPRIDEEMKIAAAFALAEAVKEPTVEEIIPDSLDKTVPQRIARAVCRVAKEKNACR